MARPRQNTSILASKGQLSPGTKHYAHYKDQGRLDEDRTAVQSTVTPFSVPKLPRWLSKAAKQEWRRVVPLLVERGTVGTVDSVTLAIYCETVARYQLALQSIQEAGLSIEVTVLDHHGKPHTSVKPNPNLRVMESAERTILKFAREAGITPRSRDGVKAVPKQAAKKELTPREKAMAEADRLLAEHQG